jgi:hypothetical protein
MKVQAGCFGFAAEGFTLAATNAAGACPPSSAVPVGRLEAATDGGDRGWEVKGWELGFGEVRVYSGGCRVVGTNAWDVERRVEC